MASKAHKDTGQLQRGKSSRKSGSSSGSDSSSTEEEERLRRLFSACDRDGDGFIDSHDLLLMCQQLNMEDAVDEIMHQLGADEHGRISFEEFAHCRMRLMSEIEQERMRSVPPRPPAPTITWPGNSDSSLGLTSIVEQSLDYDSGARDLSPEPANLYKLIENHDPDGLQKMIEIAGGTDFLDMANSLHLAALTSLKGEIIELTNRLQHMSSEKEHLEKQLNKQQTDKLRIQREAEDRIEQQTVRYEERITELHSVIAELRKKLDRHQINVIREEDEYEESDGVPSNKSNEEASVNENNANESQSNSIVDIGNDLNAELSRVVSELESAIGERKKIAADIHPDPVAQQFTDENVEDKAMQVCKEMEDFHFVPIQSEFPAEMCQYEDELRKLRIENAALQEQIGRQETELNKVKAQVGSIREERDRMKRRVRELQTRCQSLEASTSPHNSRTSTPTKSPLINPTTGERTVSGAGSTDQVPVAKIAELKKLKTGGGDRQVLGAEISSLGLPNAKVAEHLAQSLQECSNVQEIFQTLYQCGNEISENKIKEFEIEFERLTSKIDHLKSQNDLLSLTLEESKAQCDRLSVLMGKYESNITALRIAINYSDQALEAYDVLVSLLESEQGILLANCRTAGLGSLAGDESGEVTDQEQVASILHRAHTTRKSSENVAKQLIQRLDRSCGITMPGCTASPWEDLSSNSRTARDHMGDEMKSLGPGLSAGLFESNQWHFAGSTTSSTGSSADTEFSKMDEQKLRDYIQQLKNDRSAVKLTVMDLESVHIDPLATDSVPNPDAQRLDLENAVIMQELMAMKEEKAELKAQNYLMEKEKSALELQLSGKESQAQALAVQIEHLKSEVKEREAKLAKDPRYRKEEGMDTATPAITLAELRSNNASEIAQDLSEALRREKKLKARIQELVATLEKLSKNSEIRHQQSAEFVNDLKRANSALVSAFEKAKKKYQGKVKKLETQMQAMTERYETQVRMLKQRIALLEEENSRAANETSL